MLPERFGFIKKNFTEFIYEEKSGAVTKFKLV